MFVCCKYTCKYLRCRTPAISLGLVFTLPSVPFYCWKNVPGGSWGWAKSFQSCWEPTGFIIPAPGEGEHGMEGARQEMRVEKNIFTEHRVVIASGLRWVANNFVCVGQKQGINYPQPLEMGCIGNGWESSTPKFSVWQEIPALCFVLGSCLCFFLSPKGMWGRRLCEAVERFVTTNCGWIPPPDRSEIQETNLPFSVWNSTKFTKLPHLVAGDAPLRVQGKLEKKLGEKWSVKGFPEQQ